MFDYLGDLFEESAVETPETEEGDFVYTEEEDAVMEAFESIECYDDPETAMYRLAMENTENFHAIVNAITVDELTEYMATNEEVIYEESKISKVMGTIVSWIQQAWQKIKGAFEKMLSGIDSWVKQDEAFIKKYGSLISSANVTFDFEGYDYNLSRLQTGVCDNVITQFIKIAGVDTSSITGGNLENARKRIEEMASEESVNKLRGAAIGEGSITKGEFAKKLKVYFAGSEKKQKMTYSKAMASKVLDEIKTAKDSKKAAKDSYAATKKAFSKLIADAKKIQKDAIKAADKAAKKDAKSSGLMHMVGSWNKLCKDAINMSHIALNAQMAAIRGSHMQARSLASKVISKSGAPAGEKKETPVKESFSALDTVAFI